MYDFAVGFLLGVWIINSLLITIILRNLVSAFNKPLNTEINLGTHKKETE